MLYYIDNNAQLTFFSLLSCNITIQHYEKHVGIGKVLFSSTLPLFFFYLNLFPSSIGEKVRYTEKYIDETLQSKITNLGTKKSNDSFTKRTLRQSASETVEEFMELQRRSGCGRMRGGGRGWIFRFGVSMHNWSFVLALVYK